MNRILLIAACFLPFLASGMEEGNKVWVPKGLINPNSACFINAPLQLLHATVDLTSMAQELAQYGKPNSALAHYSACAQNMRSEIKELHPADLHTTMWALLRKNQGESGDANYCLTTLLQHSADTSIKEKYRELLPCYEGTKDLHTELSELFFVNVFGIRTYAPTHFFEKKQPELMVGLHASVKDGDTQLTDCLGRYFGDDTENFSVNDELVEGTCKRFLKDTQNYLFIMLDRKGVKEDGLEYFRQEEPIRSPLKELDFEPYFLEKSRNKGFYECIGIIMHSGGADGGHYSAYTKLGNQWYLCDDATVTTVPQEEIEAIAQRGYGLNKTILPTTFVYELSSARPAYT